MTFSVLLGIISAIGLSYCIYMVMPFGRAGYREKLFSFLVLSFVLRIAQSVDLMLFGTTTDIMVFFGCAAMLASGPLLFIYFSRQLHQLRFFDLYITVFVFPIGLSLFCLLVPSNIQFVYFLSFLHLLIYGLVCIFKYFRSMDYAGKQLLAGYFIIVVIYGIQLTPLNMMKYSIATFISSVVLSYLSWCQFNKAKSLKRKV